MYEIELHVITYKLIHKLHLATANPYFQAITRPAEIADSSIR